MDAKPEDKIWLIAGWRKKRNDSWLKLKSSKYANAISSWMLKDKTPDTGCGLKVFRRDIFVELPSFNHMHRYLPALYQRAGGNVENVEVSHRAREMGISKYGFWDRATVGISDRVDNDSPASVIFIVRWDGRNVFRSDAIGPASPGLEISVPLGLTKTIDLIAYDPREKDSKQRDNYYNRAVWMNTRLQR